MSEFENTQDQIRRRSTESRELSVEQKEKQVEQAEKKLAAKERAEVISKEVKNTKQQIQNIVANMAQVVKAVAAIRAQLGVATTGAIPSVVRDEQTLADLKKKLANLLGEIGDLKKALLLEETKAVREELPELSESNSVAEAELRTKHILDTLDLNT